jgi:CDP-diglyceride synthetase
MKENIRIITGQIAVQIACFIIIGIVLIGIYIIEPNNTIFSYTIYGITAILFYNYCRLNSKKNFILLATLYSILMIVIFHRSSNILRLGRNISWFILIGLFTYYLTVIEKKSGFVSQKRGLFPHGYLVSSLYILS